VAVESAGEDQGATFRVELPMMAEEGALFHEEAS
jgi:hypothetical protein